MSFDADALRAVIDTLGEGMQILTRELRYLYVNDTAARHGRRAHDELVGHLMTECYPGIEATAMFATLRRCLESREPATLETEFTFPDGTRGWFELRVEPCAEGLVILSVDVTDRKERDVARELAYRDELRALETPVIRIGRGVLLVPVVGTLDNARARHMTERVLQRVVEERARTLILDVGGVAALDTGVANHLLQTTAAVRLLGTKTILTGISAAAAMTLVHLGVDLSTMQSMSDVAEAVAAVSDRAA